MMMHEMPRLQQEYLLVCCSLHLSSLLCWPCVRRASLLVVVVALASNLLLSVLWSLVRLLFVLAAFMVVQPQSSRSTKSARRARRISKIFEASHSFTLTPITTNSLAAPYFLSSPHITPFPCPLLLATSFSGQKQSMQQLRMVSGFVTPAVALGTTLIGRLVPRGIGFQVVEGLGGAQHSKAKPE
jgi:hypothetical protein